MAYADKDKQREYQREWDKKHRVGKRHQVWLAIFYPEDCPGYEQELEENGVPCLVSPLHDRDRWTEHDAKKYASRGVVAGELKKPHRHLIAEYPAGVSYEQFREDFSFLGKDGKGPNNVKYAKSIASSALYLAHKTKECEKLGKAIYDETEIIEFCGANYLDWKSRIENAHGEMKRMREWIREPENWKLIHGEFADFQDWCDENNEEWSRLLDLKCAWAIGNYIDRRRNRGVPPAGGLSATPPQGASEPRTPNPDMFTVNSETGEIID